MMGDQLNFIIDHQLESVDEFDAILRIIIPREDAGGLSREYVLRIRIVS